MGISNNTKGLSSLFFVALSKFSDKIIDNLGEKFFDEVKTTEIGKKIIAEAKLIVPLAGIIIPVVEHVAGHFLNDAIKHAKISNNDPDKINHDMQKLLEKSILQALKNTKFVLADSFYKKNIKLIEGPIDAIKSESIRFIKLTKKRDSLHSINEDLYSNFKENKGLKFELPTFVKNLKEGVSSGDINLHPENFQDQARQFFIEKIGDKTFGCSQDELRRYADYLTDQIMICFADGLKQDENKLAWAAYQKMMLDNMNIGITKLMEGQNRIESKIDNLSTHSQNIVNISLDPNQKLELSEAIARFNDPKIFEVAFRSAVEEVFDSINDKLGKIEYIVTDTHATVKHMHKDVGDIKSWVARNQTIVFALSFLTMSGIVVYMLYLGQKPQEIKISLKESDFPRASQESVNSNSAKISSSGPGSQAQTNQTSTAMATPKPVESAKVFTKTKPVCEIDGLTFVDDKSMTNKLSFSQNENGTYGFSGYLDIQGVEGNIIADNTTLKVINGDVTGSLILNAQCSKISGVLKLKSNGAPIQISYKKE